MDRWQALKPPHHCHSTILQVLVFRRITQSVLEDVGAALTGAVVLYCFDFGSLEGRVNHIGGFFYAGDKFNVHLAAASNMGNCLLHQFNP